MMAYDCYPSCGEQKFNDRVQSVPAIKQNRILKITNRERAVLTAQMVECLPNKHEAVSSTLSTIKEMKKNFNRTL
jgi:hypothetical protein